MKELKGFARVTLQPGERREMHFTLKPDALALLDAAMAWVVEPGEFEVTVGGSLAGRLSGLFRVVA